MAAVKAYEEMVDFIAAGSRPQDVRLFQPSSEARILVSDLVAREKRGGLTQEEKSELDHYIQLEHILRLAKVRARRYEGQEGWPQALQPRKYSQFIASHG